MSIKKTVLEGSFQPLELKCNAASRAKMQRKAKQSSERVVEDELATLFSIFSYPVTQENLKMCISEDFQDL